MLQHHRASVVLLGVVRWASAFIFQSGDLPLGEDATLKADAIPDDVMSDLWEGLDVNISDQNRLTFARPVHPRRKAQRRSPRAPGKKLALLGTFDTGTHLLLQLLMKNYATRLYDACDWPTRFDADRTGHCRLWKHGINISDSEHNKGGEPLYSVLARQGVQPEDTVVIMLVRSPLATLTAWKKAPYKLAPCVRRALDRYDEGCRAGGLTWSGAGNHSRSPAVSFSSTMDAYSCYMRMYSAIRREDRLHASVLVTYEDLVISPGRVVDAIADAVGWPRRLSVALVDAPAKKGGGAVGRARALEKLRGREWLQRISSDAERKAMCKGLDTDAIEGISDNNYNPYWPSRSYAADCEGYL